MGFCDSVFTEPRKKHISLQLSFLFCNKLWTALDVTNRFIPSLMGIQIVHDVVIVSNGANKQKYCTYSFMYGTTVLIEPNKGLMMF